MATCNECRGTKQCPRCKGSGEEITLGGLGHNKRCPKCDGRGVCPRCNGSGKQ